MYKKNSTSYYGYIFLFLIFFNHSVFNLNLLPLSYKIILFLFILFLSIYRDIKLPYFNYFKIENKLNYISILIFFLISIPSIYVQYLTFNNDFNWGGDHRDHIQWSLVNIEFWISSIFSDRNDFNLINNKSLFSIFFSSRLFLLICFFFFLFSIFKLNLKTIFLLPIFLFFFLISYYENIITATPQATYFITIPINFILYFFNYELMSSISIINFLSIPFWLFFLRPCFIGRWPDLYILPFALLIYWQSEILYFVNFGFIEAWSLIFLFTSFELILKKGRKHADICCILLGIGACFKPPIGLFLPLFLIYGFNFRNIFKNSSLLLSFFISFFSLQIFSKLREINNWRWSPIQFENYSFFSFKAESFYKWKYRIDDWQLYFIISILICLIIIITNLFLKKNKNLYIFLLTSSLVLFSVYFFNTKLISYFLWLRYYIYFVIPIFSILFFLNYKNSNIIHVFLSVLIILFSSINLSNWSHVNRENLYEMNNSGQDAGPIFIGIKNIINENKKLLSDNSIKSVLISRYFHWIYRVPNYLFTDIAINVGPKDILICECENNKAIVNFFPSKNNFFNNKDESRFIKENQDLKNICMQKMKLTCKNNIYIKNQNGNIITILGIY